MLLLLIYICCSDFLERIPSRNFPVSVVSVTETSRGTLKPGFHMIVTIVAIAENGCDDPDDHMETPTSFLVTIATIITAAIVTIETISCSLLCISFLDLHHLQNGVSQQGGATSGAHINFYLRSTKV